MRGLSWMMTAFLFSISSVAFAQTVDSNPYDSLGPDGLSRARWTEWDAKYRDAHLRFFTTCIMEGRTDRTASFGAECRARPAGLPPVPADFRWDVAYLPDGGIADWPGALERLAQPAGPGRTAQSPCPAGNMQCVYARAILDYRHYCYSPMDRDMNAAHCPNDYGNLNRNLCTAAVVTSSDAACASFATFTDGGLVGWFMSQISGVSSTSERGASPTVDHREPDGPRQIPSGLGGSSRSAEGAAADGANSAGD